MKNSSEFYIENTLLSRKYNLMEKLVFEKSRLDFAHGINTALLIPKFICTKFKSPVSLHHVCKILPVHNCPPCRALIL